MGDEVTVSVQRVWAKSRGSMRKTSGLRSNQEREKGVDPF